MTSIPLHPLRATERLRDSFLRYLKTNYLLKDVSLRAEFWRALEEPGFLVKGPMLQATPEFQQGRSIQQLIQAGILCDEFERLCNTALPYTRPLHLHQDRAVEKVVKHQRNIVVATGTGSGKTEAFLIPILDSLLREQRTGTLGQAGVRALLLYPMNALANDQLKRLRGVLKDYPAITFGRYVGETEQHRAQAETLFRTQFYTAPLLNELLSRDEMQAEPPHLLLTNYAMLEYLMLRPDDHAFFDGPTARHWRYIVLDEAHIYDGASGAEIAFLIRRLKERIARSNAKQIQVIATSATLGRGRSDFPAATRFARDLFGEPFDWEEADPSRQDVVEGQVVSLAQQQANWQHPTPGLYRQLLSVLQQDAPSPDILAQSAVEAGVPESVVQAASAKSNGAVDSFLYHLLRGDPHVIALHQLLATNPQFLELAVRDIFPGEPDAMESLIGLVNLAVRAKPSPDSAPLLPARYHVFVRALEGAFVCLNEAAHAEAGQPRVFLNRREECPHCHSKVFELAKCTRCGTAYIVGRLEMDSTSSYLHPLDSHQGETNAGHEYFVLGADITAADEDEAIVEGDTDDAADEQCDAWTLCVGCGAIAPGNDTVCSCRPGTPRVPLQHIDLHGRPRLRRCVSCGAHDKVGTISTGQDAPVSVLASALYQLLPPSTDPDTRELPGERRKLLIFSDSRQDAAFFAPYVERSYHQFFRRHLILQTLREDKDAQQGDLRLDDVGQRLRNRAKAAGVFAQTDSPDTQRRQVLIWLMQEMVALDQQISLEGLGLIRFRLVRPERWKAPQRLLLEPWSLTVDEAWGVIATLLSIVRLQGCVTFPDNVSPDDEAFAPRNRALYIRERTADLKAGVYAWIPTRGGNRRWDFLYRLLAQCAPTLPEDTRRGLADEALAGLWGHITDQRTWGDHLIAENRARAGTVFRLNYKMWELAPMVGAGDLWECSRCHNLSWINIRGVCSANRCDGALVPVQRDAALWQNNHYRALYEDMLSVPLKAEEHTAQWSPKAATQVQQDFIEGAINLLSCSTTFELGVDVGELQAVLMRNMPPTTANYVQRAGRAGRRLDTAAFAVTYAQRRSHDLTYYAEPQKIVAGAIRAPAIILDNEKIVRRHVHSVLFAAFFRWAAQQGLLFKSVGSFFASPDPEQAGPSLLAQYLANRPLEVQETLKQVVPSSLHGELELETWGWTRQLLSNDRDGIFDRAALEVAEDLKELQAAEQSAATEKQYSQAGHYNRVAETIKSRELLGFLGSRNVLPKYGFPVDVVELRTNHLPIPEAGRIELQRDLRIAISEYAPGSEVVAAKRVWVSAGIHKPPARDWQEWNYAICPTCRRFHYSQTDLSAVCPTCGSDLTTTRARGKFIQPEFGFIVRNETPRESGEGRPARIYSSRAFFAEYRAPGSATVVESVVEEAPELTTPLVQVSKRYSRFGWLAAINSGLGGAGFRVCKVCGAAEPGPQPTTGRTRRSSTAHRNPKTGRECTAILQTYSIGHRFMTDVLEIRFTGSGAAHADEAVWLSTLHALLEGASHGLDIRREDLDGTLYRHAITAAPALLIFDNVPGGAGHVRRISTELRDTFAAAYDKVNRDCCGPETSCYECLRNFRNQYYHDQLKRGLARDFLATVLSRQDASE